MRPVFKMMCYSTEPDDKSCTGVWKCGDNETCIDFDDSETAFAVNVLIDTVYEMGLRDGAQGVVGTITSILSRYNHL